MIKRELSWKAKLSIYRSAQVPTLTNGHKLWLVPKELRVEPLLLLVERSQLRWFGCFPNIHLGRCLVLAHPGGDTGADQGTLERFYLMDGVSSVSSQRRLWKCLGFPAETAAPSMTYPLLTFQNISKCIKFISF